MANSPGKAVFLGHDAKLSAIQVTDTYTPTGAQSLIHVQYSGVNPADVFHALIGLHSSVTGYDCSGTVIAIGPTSPFKVGDAVFGGNFPGFRRPQYYGTHQDYVIAEPTLFNAVPPSMRMEEAAVLSIMTRTAADGLFNCLGLGFPAARLDGMNEQAILIWGGASSVGVSAIQLAKAAGMYPIFTTASPKNHQILLSLGATQCFDYNHPDVVNSIRMEVQKCGNELAHILDSIGQGSHSHGADFEKSTPAMAAKCILDNVPEMKVKLACTQMCTADPRWQMIIATRQVTPSSPFPCEPEWPERSERVMKWAVDNYGNGFMVPKVRIVKGVEDGMEAMRSVAGGKVSLEKVVVEHPM